jgi:hypothetical protein
MDMHLAQGTISNIGNAKVAIILAVIIIAAFWRAVVRLVLAILGAVILVAVGFGVLELTHALHA